MAVRDLIPATYRTGPVPARQAPLNLTVPLWVLMVTSAANRGWPGDVPVSDLVTAGLPAPSVVRSAKIATIEARDAERIGHLPPEDCTLVQATLRQGLAQVLAGGSHCYPR